MEIMFKNIPAHLLIEADLLYRNLTGGGGGGIVIANRIFVPLGKSVSLIEDLTKKV